MEVFAELLINGEYWIAAAILVLLVATQLPKITDFYRNNRNQRCLAITDALNDPNVSTELKKHLKNELNIEHFRKAHGIRLSMPMLTAIFVLNDRVGSQVSFRHLLKTIGAFPNVSDIADFSFRVRLSKFEKIFGVFNLVCGLIVATVGLVSTLFSVYSLVVDFNASYLILGLIAMPLGFNMLSDGSVVFSVYHVNNALESYEKTHGEKSL
ncbi:hypothetical protein ACODG7_16510 [Vibrio anguillarum]|uniref:hypothetical protein n=1 Tax=Vibrio TaxID=662 RepID=UPI0002E65BD4|nr:MULTISPECIES: hypothetical protein [Vibrio]EGR2915201.1 hypothetical protein [Vibrio parahaemolyticus]MDQ2166388.1 hypothetical protein [Vibrio anguillarum]NNN97792.1 hypothetical protein [Vibrio sp. B4-6]OEE39294.1 hypothetical protein A1QW_16815 [Vibrio anguillarum]OEF91846.1 hypothetical protein A1QY_13640 [Vibrio anguillarum]